ncbi:ATP synthase F0 subunit C [Aceticella autotrophica]|uniref:ATP synthase subunit c n=1 Tax=Aceticella autotrophica TaxID=2755338 RepID=A0A975GAL0_9THEO|nr:ATP synthase F0 subunit C [Aceticella autotrophica]QSZ27296.1 ATP synthase F0 subunit C [Aceticella autotrophica]
MNLMAIGIGMVAFSCLGAGLGLGYATARAVEAVSRQPEAHGSIMQLLLLGGALCEATAIYGLLIAFLMIFFMK